MNPHNSPWLKNVKKPTVKDIVLRHKFAKIQHYSNNNLLGVEYNGILAINKHIYIAKNSIKFRIKSHLDWAYYTPKTLADAIDNNCVDAYYEIMLHDVRSDPNVWKDHDFEMILKSYYAARANRAEII